jgi:hypothetical protein
VLLPSLVSPIIPTSIIVEIRLIYPDMAKGIREYGNGIQKHMKYTFFIMVANPWL